MRSGHKGHAKEGCSKGVAFQEGSKGEGEVVGDCSKRRAAGAQTWKEEVEEEKMGAEEHRA